MMIWDDGSPGCIVGYMGKQGQDNSGTALTFLKQMYNVGYKKLLVEFGREVTERTAFTTLVAGQRGYTVMPDCLFPKVIEMVDSTTRYPLTEVASSKHWAYMKSGNMQGRSTHYHYKPRFGIAGGVLELWPIPSSSNYKIEMIYEASDRDLSETVYSTGSVTLTAGSTAVLGAGTTFTQSMVGRYLFPTSDTADQQPYRITQFTDTTHITLETDYNAQTLGGLTFKIVDIPNLPEDMHIIPAYFALDEWWSSKGNAKKTAEFHQKFKDAMILAKKTHAGVTRDDIVNPDMPMLPFEQYPLNYPTEITA